MRRLTASILIFLIYTNLEGQNLRVEKVTLFGNTRTKKDVILRELNICGGGMLSYETLSNERTWLLRLDFLKRVEFLMKSGSAPDLVNLLVVVQEKGWLSIKPILSNNDLFGWYGGATLTIRNLLGRRNRIDFTSQLGSIRNFELSWENPWMGRSIRLFAGIDLFDTSYRYMYDDHPVHFKLKSSGGSLFIGKSFGRKTRIGIRTGYEELRTDDTSASLSGTGIDRILGLRWFFSFDSRDWPLYPKRGLYICSWIERSSVLDSKPFWHWTGEIRFYGYVYKQNIAALQIFGELSRGNIPVAKRIHLGGARTLRGYRTGTLSGENCLWTSLEYRFPIIYERNPLAGIHAGYAGVLFFDAGTAWFNGERFSSLRIIASGGIGIHFILDRWVFRIEYGNHGKGWGFINIGTGVKF